MMVALVMVMVMVLMLVMMMDLRLPHHPPTLARQLAWEDMEAEIDRGA